MFMKNNPEKTPKKQKITRVKFTTKLKPEVIQYIKENGGNKFVEALVESYKALS